MATHDATVRRWGLSLGIVLIGLTVGACNTLKATTDTTVNFFSSTSPNELFSKDGMVLKEQRINLFAGVNYDNLRQQAAAGGGEYVSSLAALYEIPASKYTDFSKILQSRHESLFTAELSEDRQAHLKMVQALNEALTTASLMP